MGLVGILLGKDRNTMTYMQDFIEKEQSFLQLKVLYQKTKMERMNMQDIHRASLLFLKETVANSFVLVFGKEEIYYLQQVAIEKRKKLLQRCFVKMPTAVFICDNENMEEIYNLCKKNDIFFLRSKLKATLFLRRISFALEKYFAKCMFLHGTFLKVFHTGVLILGEANMGKSTLAWQLLQRGHKFIADDLVKITKQYESELIGSSPSSAKLLHIKPWTIVSVKEIFGNLALMDNKKIDVVLRLTNKVDKKKYWQFMGIILPLLTIDVFQQSNITSYVEMLILLQKQNDVLSSKQNTVKK